MGNTVIYILEYERGEKKPCLKAFTLNLFKVWHKRRHWNTARRDSCGAAAELMLTLNLIKITIITMDFGLVSANQQ